MIEFITAILNLESYIEPLIKNNGIFVYPLLFLIIFLETGFVIAPFLPGDSLLFIVGTLASKGILNLYSLIVLLSFAAIIGDSVNYMIGNFFGKRVFAKFMRKEYLERTEKFYDKHGAKTIVLARFIPIIRSFAPFVAGIGKMNYLKFLFYNIIGGVLWVVLFVLAGYFFGGIPLIKNNLTSFILLILIISIIPLIITYFKNRK